MCLSHFSCCQDHVADICLYLPFCIVLVILGIVQIISGIFYFITIPVIKLIVNICIGCWVILTGIGGGMVTCVCTSSSPKKHEFLLYCSLSVLVLNTVNLIFLEFGQLKELFGDNVQKNFHKELEILESPSGRMITTLTAIASVLISFVESQISFCLLNRAQLTHTRDKILRDKNRRMYIDNDQSADLEYVIPKKDDDPDRNVSNGDTAVQVYTKSWVFDGAGEEEELNDRSLSISSSSPSHSNAPNHTAPNCSNQRRISKVSKLSDATSERFMLQMTSFSRCATPSPVPRSGQTTPVIAHFSDYMDTSSVHGHKSNRLTVDYVSSAASSSKPKTTTQGPSSISSQPDDGQFASLLAELEQSLMEKKIQSGLSPDNASLTPSTDKYSSKSSSKDLEFSKELEAALQLIQELETPSEGPLGHATMQNQHIVRSDSEKTLSAAASLPSPEACPFSARTSDGPTPTGKQSLNILSIETNSQSTSGYSSPNSYSSNLYSIKELDTGCSGFVEQQHSPTTNSCHNNNVVKIYIEPSRNTSYIKTLDPGNLPIADNPISLTSSKSNSVNKSFLLFKKRSKLMPQGDFQNRIFKSECLAYLTEEELMARHQQNRNMIRKIELDVAQKVKGCRRIE